MSGTSTWIQFNNYTRETNTGVKILENVSFSIPKNKTVLLIGLSGDGKTTLMNAIYGHCDSAYRTYGSVLTPAKDGEQMVPRNVSEWFKDVSFCRQDLWKYGKISMHTILCSIAACYGICRKEVDSLIAEFDLVRQRNVSFDNLSGGQQKRVLVIAGLLSKKSLSIWDEPLSGLDSVIAIKTLSTIKGACDTSIMSVHQLSEEIIKYFDYTLIMYKNTVIYSGPIDQIVSYFTQRGLVLKSEMFYITYLLHLFANKEESEQDRANIVQLQSIYQGIVGQPQGRQTPGNIAWVPFGALRWTNVKEIFCRSLYFSKTFKLRPLLTELFVYLFLTVLFLLLNRSGALFAVHGKTAAEADRHVGRFISELADQLVPNSGATESQAINRFVLCGYLSLFLRLSVVFSLAGFVSSCCTLNKDFTRILRTNITDGQFTTLEFIMTVLMEIIVRKVLMMFAALVTFFLYCSTQTVDARVFAISEISRGVFIFGLFLLSVLGGLVQLAIILLPIMKMIRSFIGTSYLFSCVILIDLVWYNLAHYSSTIASDSSGYYTVNSMAGMLIDAYQDKNSTTPDKINTITRTTYYIALGLHKIYIFSPFVFFKEWLVKLYLYNGKLPYGGEFKGGNSLVIEELNMAKKLIEDSERNGQKISLPPALDPRNLLKQMSSSVIKMPAHELSDFKTLIPPVTVFTLFKTFLIYWCPIIIICTLLTAYKYRCMQPKLRS
ncbi:hypothetical protein NEHOM01_0883 [Nematocida homosporus]|uniref:uncharacterized protein n=1 Tax=Nematocida homosporus TaxID=1912981 RepID=UPI002220D491|nr:uncharacterized protein NEHOM01_0883 [Nematocida homosporus]KAI5185524.1 hypothetical protein NEHOM01_0883 [Nematocida homosporus]